VERRLQLDPMAACAPSWATAARLSITATAGPPMPSLNLKAKFALLTGTMILAVAVIVTVFLTYQQARTIREEFVRRALALTENLAYSAQLPLAAQNRTSLARLGEGLLKESELAYVSFQTADGVELLALRADTTTAADVVTVSDARVHPSGTRSAWVRNESGRTFLDVYTAVVVEGGNEDDILATQRDAADEVLGYVRVGMTAEAAEARIARMRLLAGALGLAIALACSLLAAALIHVMTRPLAQLMEGNRRVARGDFSLRLEVRSRDEFGRLAGSYNQMALEIQRSRELAESYLASLRANADHLEEANRALQHTNQELAKASRMKSEFLAVMSHELRTPLNVIIGFSEVLLDQTFGAVNPKQERYVSNILTSGRHLLALINDILDLSKVEAGKMQVAPAPFDLRQSLDEIQSLVRNLAAKKAIEVRCGDVPALTPVTDQKLFKQVMLNLLSNAIKFTPEGGSVELRVRSMDGKVLRGDAASRRMPPQRRGAIQPRLVLLVEVRDTGVGIAPEDQERIFEAFQQVDASYARRQEGTGLGLALTRRIVQLLGGEIWFESVRDEGSTFWFYVPFEFDERDSDVLGNLGAVAHGGAAPAGADFFAGSAARTPSAAAGAAPPAAAAAGADAATASAWPWGGEGPQDAAAEDGAPARAPRPATARPPSPAPAPVPVTPDEP
jgi:signal transduction histidine kinase